MIPTSLLFTLIPVLITAQLFFISKVVSTDSTPILTVISQLAALLGATLLSQNLILSSRLPLLDRWFGGFDKTIKAHRTIGTYAFVFIVQHLVFLVLALAPRFTGTLVYIVPSLGNIPYASGILALWLMLVLMICTLFVDMPYHIWKKVHELFSWVFLLGSFHALTITSDISRYLPLRYWMLIIISLGFAAVVYRRILYTYIGPRHKYTVDHVNRIGDIIELLLTPSGSPLQYRPGQFAFLSVQDKAIGNEDHPFSISSSPTDRFLRFSIKITGDYTLQLTQLRPKTEILVWGPYGNFGEKLYSPGNIVMVAGGIGISPFLGMVRSVIYSLSGKKINLFYTTRSPDEAVYTPELQLLSTYNPCFSYNLHCSKTAGRLSADVIRTNVQELENSIIFLCGPPGMMTSLSYQFHALGVKKRQIIFEDFSFV